MKTNRHLKEINLLLEFIEDNITSDLSVTKVCENTSFSCWEIQRLFRAYTGDTIANYIRGRRLTLAAKRLLSGQKIGILDLAIEFQFGSQEAFTRAFKDMFKITPGKIGKSGIKNLSSAKPILSANRLSYIANLVSKKPDIKVLSSKILYGLPTTIDSTLSTDKESYQAVKKHWKLFFQNFPSERILNPHGLITGSNESMDDERLIYSACLELDSEDTPSPLLTRYELPEGLYASFEVKNSNQSCHMVADYVYGIWLPQSGYNRRKGYDFEVFDVGQNCNANKVVHYHIPISKE